MGGGPINDHPLYHIRMKGIPGSCINHKVKTEFENDPMALYKHLYEGNKVKFNLLENGKKGGAVMFKASKNYSIANETSFGREISF